MEIDTPLVLSLTSIVISVVGFVVGYVKYLMAQAKQITKLEDQMKETADKIDILVKEEDGKKERLKALEVKMELWWGAIQNQVINMLKHPHAQRRDMLLDKLADKTITLRELEELKETLKCNALNKKKEAFAAALVIARIEQLTYDFQRVMPKPGSIIR